MRSAGFSIVGVVTASGVGRPNPDTKTEPRASLMRYERLPWPSPLQEEPPPWEPWQEPARRLVDTSRHSTAYLIQRDDPASDVGVWCGAHLARACSLCPGARGKDWCNGDCEWTNGTCAFRSDLIWCGGHSSARCQDCPWLGNVFKGEVWCHGDCLWNASELKSNGGTCISRHHMHMAQGGSNESADNSVSTSSAAPASSKGSWGFWPLSPSPSTLSPSSAESQPDQSKVAGAEASGRTSNGTSGSANQTSKSANITSKSAAGTSMGGGASENISVTSNGSQSGEKVSESSTDAGTTPKSSASSGDKVTMDDKDNDRMTIRAPERVPIWELTFIFTTWECVLCTLCCCGVSTYGISKSKPQEGTGESQDPSAENADASPSSVDKQDSNEQQSADKDASGKQDEASKDEASKPDGDDSKPSTAP